jgi:hypothetical protein
MKELEISVLIETGGGGGERGRIRLQWPGLKW